jgi:FkbM family methyltransferase
MIKYKLIQLAKSNSAVGFFLKKLEHLIRSFSRTYSSRNKISTEASKILPSISCIDVGASYYPHPAWEVFRRSENTFWVAVEPNVKNLFYLKYWHYPATVIPVEMGLSEKGGKQILYITNIDSGSSLYEPVIEKNMEHRIPSLDYFFPLKRVEIDTLTINDVVKKLKSTTDPIAIKIDTQGTEFSILRALDEYVIKTRLICIELESTLLATPLMKGSSHFFEIQEFFQRYNFELVYFKPIPLLSPEANKDLQGSSILNECDAVFLLRSDEIRKRDIDFQLSMVGFYISYELYGEALLLLKNILQTSDSASSKFPIITKLIKLLS